MFNALSSEDLLMGVGRVLRTVAAASGPLEEYERSQALSAYSITRLLAAEQAAAAGLLSQTRKALLQALDADPSVTSPSGESQTTPEVAEGRRSIELAQTENEVGDALAAVLAALPGESPARRRIHRALSEMIDAEVAALATARR